jgi:hypothetical protein
MMRNRIIKWLFRRIFGRLKSSGACSNRCYWTYVNGDFQYELTRRQTTLPDTYSREELYRMAKIIRTEQERTGWDVFSCFDSPTSIK